MKSLRVSAWLFSAAVYMTFLTTASAHDIWITLAGPAAARRAVVNYGHPDDREPTVADKIIDIFAITASARQPLINGLSFEREGPWFVVETKPFQDDGHTLLSVRYDNGYWIKTADGYRNATRREVPGALDSLWSMKFGKALTGPGAPWAKALGQDLEIVPLVDPFAVRVGEILRVRVLFHGKPLTGGKVERADAITPVPEGQIPSFTTDSDGIAAIPIVKTGPTQLAIDYNVTPSATPDLAKTDMYNATLWYALPR